MACLRTSDATYDNLKNTRNRHENATESQEKKAQKIASVNNFGPSYVSPMWRGKKKKRYRTVIETWQFYKGW